jgi:cytoskeleton-associated protein 5
MLSSFTDPPLKPIQITELTTQFADLDSKNEGYPTGKQIRLTRSQQREKMLREAEGQLEGKSPAETEDQSGKAEEQEEIDPEKLAFEMAEPVDVTKKLPEGFYEKILSSKWKERKEEALDPLLSVLTNTPKALASVDYSELIRALAGRIGGDSNIQCATVAVQCVGLLGKALRGSFGKYRELVVKPLLEKYKEKKQNVVDAISQTLDVVFGSSTLPEFMEDVITFLKHKTPSVKAETSAFLTRCLMITTVPPPKGELGNLAGAILANIGDGNEVVRTKSQECFATLMKVVGEKTLSKEFEGMDEMRKAKVMEYFKGGFSLPSDLFLEMRMMIGMMENRRQGQIQSDDCCSQS